MLARARRGSLGNNRTVHVSPDEIGPDEIEGPDGFKWYNDRNGGTFVAVRQTPQTRKFLSDALNIVSHPTTHARSDGPQTDHPSPST